MSKDKEELDQERIYRNMQTISIGKAIVRRRYEKIRYACIIALLLLMIFIFFAAGYRKQDKSRPRYVSTNIISTIDDGRVVQFARAITGQLSGQIGEVYQLGDDTYYIVVYLGNKASGGSVVRYKGENKPAEVISSSENLLTQEQLQKLQEDEYLQIRYSSGVRAESSGNSFANAVHSAGTKEVDVKDNSIVLSDEDLAEIIENAEKEEHKLTEIFGDDILGEDYSIVLTIRCRYVNLRQTASITLDSTIAKEIGAAGKVRVVLGDERQVISLSKEQLEKLCKAYKSLTVEITQKSDNEYELGFKDSEGKYISELYGTVDICLPADNELTYVYADYGNSTETRGGKYDENLKTITFSCRLSGSYSLIGNNVSIADMENPGNDILFMAATGFMQLDKKNCFRPDDYITRNELIYAVARMFLAIDRDLSGTDSQSPVLSDLNVSDDEYRYIAAGFYSEVVGGYSDGSFGGEMNASMEEILTVCSRTLISRKIEIEDKEKKASDYFTDAEKISKYAVEHVVNSVNAGLIGESGELNPSAFVRRAEAAEILYRMYRVLYGAGH